MNNIIFSQELSFLIAYAENLKLFLSAYLTGNEVQMRPWEIFPSENPLNYWLSTQNINTRDIDLLYFTAALQTDPELPNMLSSFAGNYTATPYAWLKLISLDEPYLQWSEQFRFAPDRPLFQYNIINLTNESIIPRLASTMTIPNDVLSAIRGERCLDETLQPWVTRREPLRPIPFPPFNEDAVFTIKNLLRDYNKNTTLEKSLHSILWNSIKSTPIAISAAEHDYPLTQLMLAICKQMGFPLLIIDAKCFELISNTQAVQLILALLRQAEIFAEIVLIENADKYFTNNSPLSTALLAAMNTYQAYLFLATQNPHNLAEDIKAHIPMHFNLQPDNFNPKTSAIEYWENNIHTYGFELLEPDNCAEKYPLSARQIQHIAATARCLSQDPKMTAQDELEKAYQLQLCKNEN